MKRLERKQEKERLERQIHQQMLKEQESLMKELRTMLPEAAESFSSERIVCLCHVVDLCRSLREGRDQRLQRWEITCFFERVDSGDRKSVV